MQHAHGGLIRAWGVRQMRFWVAVPLRLACTVLTAVSLPTVRVNGALNNCRPTPFASTAPPRTMPFISLILIALHVIGLSIQHIWVA